jgi:hypothetical protein
MNSNIRAIVKLIEVLYSPAEIKVRKSEFDDEILIDVYFYDIDDSYITNPNHYNPDQLKEQNFEREIRRTILNYLDIKTSGFNAGTGFPPYEIYGITINVMLIK